MLQVSVLEEDTDRVLKRLAVKNFTETRLVHEAIEYDRERKRLRLETDQLLNESGKLAGQIGALMKEKKGVEAEHLKGRTLLIKDQVKVLQVQLAEAENKLISRLVLIPNLPHESVPSGKLPEDNEVISSLEEVKLSESALPHWELLQKHQLADFELGVKVTGAGFPFYLGKGAKLQRALINFFLDEAVKAGYTEVQPPVLVNESSAFGTGQLPDKEGQMYHVIADGFYLVPTAEVPVTNIFRDSIVSKSDLPLRRCAYTPCFRREAGSYGASVRGLNRLHQFDKVELVQVSTPDHSYCQLDEMNAHVARLLSLLSLPYRLLRLCGGDMTFSSALTYDFEVYSAAQKKWLEVSSVSNFESYQANRLKLRYKDEQGKSQLAHTLNGSALALPRIVAALLENNQDAEGIRIPPALVPYTGFERI